MHTSSDSIGKIGYPADTEDCCLAEQLGDLIVSSQNMGLKPHFLNKSTSPTSIGVVMMGAKCSMCLDLSKQFKIMITKATSEIVDYPSDHSKHLLDLIVQQDIFTLNDAILMVMAEHPTAKLNSLSQ